MTTINPPEMPTPQQSQTLLVEGNQRFREGKSTWVGKAWNRTDMSPTNQKPFAVVLGCSDSRTPVEILFDQGFGDLFVVRIAGNVVAPSVIGSVEFAVSKFGSRLVVVMGHTQCGAVSATIEAIETGAGPGSKNLQSITDRIAPHIEELVRNGQPGKIWRSGVRANVRASADHLRHGSVMLEKLVESGQVAIVGAEYELETGIVHFFENPQGA